MEISVFASLNACDDMWVHTSQQRRTLKAAQTRVRGIPHAPKKKKKIKKTTPAEDGTIWWIAAGRAGPDYLCSRAYSGKSDEIFGAFQGERT